MTFLFSKRPSTKQTISSLLSAWCLLVSNFDSVSIRRNQNKRCLFNFDLRAISIACATKIDMIKTDKGYRGLDRTRQVWRIFCHGMQGSLALPVRICSLTCLHTTVLTATAATLGSGFLDRCVSTFTRFTSGSRPWFIVQDDRFLGSSWVLQVCSSSSGFSVTMCDGV